jgi:hypothetical protein
MPAVRVAIGRIARSASRVPRLATADRYGEPATDRGLEAVGVGAVAISRKA